MNVADFECGHSQSELADRWEGMALGERIQVEGEHRRKDGSKFPVEVWVTKIEVEGRERFIALSRDISARKEYERTLERQNERLEAFASIVSHDLRNPLNVAAGRLELVEAECESEHLPVIADSLDRMSELIDDTLTLARQGKTVDSLEAVTLSGLVNSCWQNVETAGASFTQEGDLTFQGDPERLRSLVENLFRNAIEHGADGVSVRVGPIESEGFYVADDGPGIPEAQRDDVFDLGYSTARASTGFGLAITKEIVEAHGWEIDVTESVDGGARFEIRGVDSIDT